eukprot:UN26558
MGPYSNLSNADSETPTRSMALNFPTNVKTHGSDSEDDFRQGGKHKKTASTMEWTKIHSDNYTKNTISK